MTNGAGHHDGKKKAAQRKPHGKKAKTTKDAARSTLIKGVRGTPPPSAS